MARFSVVSHSIPAFLTLVSFLLYLPLVVTARIHQDSNRILIVALGLLSNLLSGLMMQFVVQATFPRYLQVMKFLLNRAGSQTYFDDSSLCFAICGCLVHWFCYYGMMKSLQVVRAIDNFPGRSPRSPSQEASPELLKLRQTEAFKSHFFSAPFVYYFIYQLNRWLGHPDILAPLGDWTGILGRFCGATLVYEIYFYFAHRAFHHPVLYQFHKEHHRWTGSIAQAAEHAHILEVLLVNTPTTFLGPILFSMHPWEFLVFLFQRLCITGIGHNGFSFLGSVDYHEYHHAANDGNFGASPMTDALLGTLSLTMKKKKTKGN